MSALFLKEDVKLSGIDLNMVEALAIVCGVFRAYSTDVTVTSALDGEHAPRSKHYVGRALDFRIHGLTMIQARTIADEVDHLLGPDYTVILESMGQPNEHLHVQFNR